MRRLIALLAAVLILLSLSSAVEATGDIPPAVNTPPGEDTESSVPQVIYTVTGFIKQPIPYWKEVILLEADQTLDPNALPPQLAERDKLICATDNGEPFALPATWSVEVSPDPGLHYITGTVHMYENTVLAEDFDGIATWPVFRLGGDAVLQAGCELPVMTDPLIVQNEDPAEQVAFALPEARVLVDGDAYLPLEGLSWSWDWSGVDTAVPGKYSVTGELSPLPEWISIPAEQTRVSFPVYVLPGDRIEIYGLLHFDQDRLVIGWPYESTAVSAVVLERKTEDGSWEPCPNAWYHWSVYGRNRLSLYLLEFPAETDIVLRLRYQDTVGGVPEERFSEPVVLNVPANIGEIMAQETPKVPDDLVNGDRDGGDSGGTQLPDYEQPAPEPPQETPPEEPAPEQPPAAEPEPQPTAPPVTEPEPQPTVPPVTEPEPQPTAPPVADPEPQPTEPETQPTAPPAVEPETQPATEPPSKVESQPKPTQPPVKEVVTDTYSAISGLRVRRLAAQGDTVLFEKQGVSLEIPSALLEKLNLGDYDLLEVTIMRPQRNGIHIMVEADGKTVADLCGSMVSLPWDESDGSLLECRDSDGAAAGEVFFDTNSGIARFAVAAPGTYFLTAAPEPETQPPRETETVPTEPAQTTAQDPEAPVEKKSDFSVLVWLLPVLLIAAGYEAYVLWRRWRNG